MSDDLTTLLREAADGPVPPIDAADLRRRGQRRRFTARTIEAGGLAAVMALGLAVLPDLGTTAPVVDEAPMASSGGVDDDAGPDQDGGSDVERDPVAPGPAAGGPLGSTPEVDPDEDVPPFGPWRPAESPVDLAPLSMRDDAEIWYLDGEPAIENLADAEAIADRLGSRDTFDELCAFLTEQIETAHREVDLAGEDPNRVAEAVTYLLLRQEEVHGGDGLTLAIALACGVADDAPSP